MKNYNKILIYMPKGLGNCIMFLPFLIKLRNKFNRSKIILLFLGKPNYIDMIKCQGLCNEIIYIDGKKDILNKILKIRALRIDLLIAKFNSQRIEHILITMFSKIPKRIGHVSSGGWKGRIDLLYNCPVKMRYNQHEIDRNNLLGMPLKLGEISKKPTIIVPVTIKSKINKYLLTKGISEESQFITVHPFSSKQQTFKCWPINYWITLMKILSYSKISFFIIGTEKENNSEIEKIFRNNNFCLNAIGELTTIEVSELIRRSSLLICNDSGPMHIAVGVKTRSVVIYCAQDYTRSIPRSNINVVLRKDKRLYKHIDTLINFKYDNESPINKMYKDHIRPEEVFKIAKFIYHNPKKIVPKNMSSHIINY